MPRPFAKAKYVILTPSRLRPSANTPTTSSALCCSVEPQKMKEQIALKAREQESICQQIVLHLCARILTNFQQGWVAIESVERASINQSVLHSFARELCVWRGGSLKWRLIYCSTLTVYGDVIESHLINIFWLVFLCYIIYTNNPLNLSSCLQIVSQRCNCKIY